MKKGFTLVELSIVLVIIGLLIGGILVAQSLIDSAKIQKFTREIAQYDAVISQFRTRYKQLPGDATMFNGNGNGLVTSGASWYDAHFNVEISYFWRDISTVGMLQETYTNVNSGDLLIGTNVPKTTLGEDIGLVVGTAYNGPGGAHVFPYNTLVYQIRSNGITGNNLSMSSGSQPISTAIALSIDQKIDDGIADDGEVRASSGNYIAGATAGNMADCNGGSAASYDISNTDDNSCSLAIRVFGQVGEE